MNRFHITKKIYIPIVKTLFLLFILWGLGAMLKILPMFKELTLSKVSFTVTDLVNMVIALLMVIVLINFAREIGTQLKRSIKQFPESGTLVTSLVYIIAVVISYDALIPLGMYLFEDKYWVYQVGFLILLLIPLVFAGTIFYRNADNMIELVSGKMRKTISKTNEVECQKCGTLNMPEAKFCVSCGSEIIVPQTGLANMVCQECGVENDPTAKFCFQCGAKVPHPKIESEGLLCPTCGEGNEADAGFCIECGTRLT